MEWKKIENRLPKTLEDCKRIFDESGQWRYVIIGVDKQPLCMLQTYEDAKECLNDYLKVGRPVREIIDLLYWDKNYWEQYTDFEGYLEQTNEKVTGICEKHTIETGRVRDYVRTFAVNEPLKEYYKPQKLKLSTGEAVDVYKTDRLNQLIEI